jgi:hypothetical protein
MHETKVWGLTLAITWPQYAMAIKKGVLVAAQVHGIVCRVHACVSGTWFKTSFEFRAGM